MKKVLSIAMLLLGCMLYVAPDVSAQDDLFVKSTPKTDLYQEINAYRASYGLPALEISKGLERSATIWALDRAVFVGSTQGHSDAWLNRGNKKKGELLGQSYKPMEQWKFSAPHKSILLSKGFTHMGLGRCGQGYVLRLMRS